MIIITLLCHSYSRDIHVCHFSIRVHFSESNRLLNCQVPLSEELPVISVLIFICCSPLGHSTRRKIQIFINISTLFCTCNFLFLVCDTVTTWGRPGCWIGAYYYYWCLWHLSIGNHQSLEAAESILCWIETTEMIVLNRQLLSLAVLVV